MRLPICRVVLARRSRTAATLTEIFKTTFSPQISMVGGVRNDIDIGISHLIDTRDHCRALHIA